MATKPGPKLVKAGTWDTAQDFPDNLFKVVGSSDATKKVAFEVDGLTTGTTRTITVSDNSYELGSAPEVKSADFTAALGFRYNLTATLTVTDPSPAEGKGFECVVRNGTATIGGTTYSVAGTMVRRIYHSGAWANYVVPVTSGSYTWSSWQGFGSGATAAVDTEVARFNSTTALTLALNSGDVLIGNGRVYALSGVQTGRVSAQANLGTANAFSGSYATIESTSATRAARAVAAYTGTTAGTAPIEALARSRGTVVGTQVAVVSGDVLWRTQYIGDNGTDMTSRAAEFRAVVGGAVSGTTVPGELRWFTTNTSGTLTQGMTLTAAQELVIAGTTASTSTTTGSITTSGGIGAFGQVTARRFGTAVGTVSTTGVITALASDDGLTRLTGAAPDLQGIAAPTGGANELILYCTNATTLRNENAGASAANRIVSDTGADVTVSAGACAELVYDPTSTRWRITSNSGSAGSGGSRVASTAFGYSTGAGGTVTQGSGSGKSTGVTLNELTGDITMNGAFMAANARVTFTLTNSEIAATDFVLVQHISGGTVGAYFCTAVASAGSAAITVYNGPDAGRTESPVLKYIVFKAVTT